MTSDDRDRPGLPVVPSLRVRQPPASTATPAAQGPAPADLAGREAPPVPPPSAEGLSAAEVSALVGEDAAVTETNRALDEAEGLDPDPSG